MSTVLEGDIVNMSASLGCANALGGEIQVLGMTFIQSPPVALSDDYYDDTGNINDNDNEGGESPGKKTMSPSLFRLSNGDTTINLLHPADPASASASAVPGSLTGSGGKETAGGDNGHSLGLDSAAASAISANPTPTTTSSSASTTATAHSDVLLKKGEVYVCSTDILCVESLEAPTLPFTAQVASMGDLYVDWRLHNNQMLSPPDLSPWVKTSDTSTALPLDITNFDWLLQWGPLKNLQTDPDDNKQAIDKRTSTTRVCGMVFSVPRVKVSPSPFTVSVSLSSSCKKNEILPLIIKIRNKLWSSENLSLTVDTTLSSSGPPGSPGTSSSSSSSSSSALGAKEVGSDSSVGPVPCGFLVAGNASALLDVRSTAVFVSVSVSSFYYLLQFVVSFNRILCSAMFEIVYD